MLGDGGRHNTIAQSKRGRIYMVKGRSYHGELGQIQMWRVPVFVKKGNVIAVKDIHKKLCHELALTDEYKYFVLVSHQQGYFTTKFKLEDTLSLPLPELHLRKWVFDMLLESELLSAPSCLNLLYLAAKERIELGIIKPDVETLQLLEEYDDPSFPLPAKYIRSCQYLPHYTSEWFPTVLVIHRFPSKQSQLMEDDVVELMLTKCGIQIYKDSCGYFVFWNKVKSWSCDRSECQVKFEIATNHGRSSGELVFATPQCDYMNAVVSEFISLAQKKTSGLTGFLTSMIHRLSATETKIDNPLFAPVACDNPLFSPAIADDPSYSPETRSLEEDVMDGMHDLSMSPA